MSCCRRWRVGFISPIFEKWEIWDGKGLIIKVIFFSFDSGKIVKIN
jgi:hypothetical protein